MLKAPDLASALAYSRYATGMVDARPDEHARLGATIDAPFPWDSAVATIDACVDRGEAEALASALRTLRLRVFLHTLARDLTGRAQLPEVCLTTTALAETALRAALVLHHRALAATHGEPRDADGNPQELVIV
ncbi:MAG TPA: bifunctional glutamine synthetase adenylyltransferase/deadenyltransferase, partial [Casimicrobiaceae bacterium]|nr:bifunctional glutamine synthetase adenylyltransferase/deadenyltransferase [Casimicrobiaceae bacterium]